MWSCTDEYLLDKIGLDAVLFLRFWRMCRNIFICLGLLGSAVIIPFNVVVGLKTVGGQASVAKNKYHPWEGREVLTLVRWGCFRLRGLRRGIYGCKLHFHGSSISSSSSGFIEDTLE